MNAEFYEDRLDRLLELAIDRMEGCKPEDYQSVEMREWLAGKKEAYRLMAEDIGFAGGRRRAVRKAARDMLKTPEVAE